MLRIAPSAAADAGKYTTDSETRRGFTQLTRSQQPAARRPDARRERTSSSFPPREFPRRHYARWLFFTRVFRDRQVAGDGDGFQRTLSDFYHLPGRLAPERLLLPVIGSIETEETLASRCDATKTEQSSPQTLVAWNYHYSSLSMTANAAEV